MAIGDQDDIAARLERVLAPWFGDDDDAKAAINALMRAPAWALAQLHSLVVYARKQTRLATATDGWLELVAYDFLGDELPRATDEPDAEYSLRIRREIVRDRVTRKALSQLIIDLTGSAPEMYRPTRAGDCGGWGMPGLAYGRVGKWGSRRAPYEVWLTVPYPQGYGIPDRGGWGTGVGGYGVGNFSYVDDADLKGSGPTATDILAAVAANKAAGVTAYVIFTFP